MKTSGLNPNGALVVFSGGQDSATCLAWALDRFEHVETVGFHYGQVHHVEMTVRHTVRDKIAALNGGWRSCLMADHVFDAGIIGQIGQSPLTGGTAASMLSQNLPDTFVPGRNLLFLTLSAALAYRRGLKHIITGVCETDFSGYPDCRDDTIKALQVAVNLGTDAPFVIHTPLMWIDKAQTWALAHELGGDELVRVIQQETHTCYRGDRVDLHDWGYGCGECAACMLRSSGWKSFQRSKKQAA
ncbi:7-cyano-7-deazaguanine synthase QueC [Dyella japonica]|uniref:7-cyano-7-deazaguanine synthase n=1 Tax=Dyella japonica TaxID=231455 RepID=A0ABV2JWA6_9GAMM